MTMDLIRSNTPPTARTWRYWARFWTLNAAMSGALGLFGLGAATPRVGFWGTLLVWAVLCAGMAKAVWAGARRRG